MEMISSNVPMMVVEHLPLMRIPKHIVPQRSPQMRNRLAQEQIVPLMIVQ